MFTRIGAGSRNFLASLDSTTGDVTDWDPDPDAEVLALALSEDGNALYVSGHFTYIGGWLHEGMAAFYVETGGTMNWDPAPKLTHNGIDFFPGQVHTMWVSGGLVYAGGRFTSIGGQNRAGLAALDATTGLATAWDPNVLLRDGLVYTRGFAYAIWVSDGLVYAGACLRT